MTQIYNEWLERQAQEIKKLKKERDALAIALYNVMIDLHPTYPSTAGPYGGVGGQAITPWCHINDPYNDEHGELYEKAWQLLRYQLWRAEEDGYYLVERL